ncbi:pentapeptide repeat-containing protein [Saccharothrix luteola]|uniref:pentapeptide repeat-containing protein n=1 Tax=Saccharothrix luteola TaxID=2893018 RepID=UPI001E3A1968|nr:pentapeptide repeat-containing protein [Saccharothrix luteola]MCC8249016.1 pentapeptide repeat-containing protein [Saccharothrix luteola]
MEHLWIAGAVVSVAALVWLMVGRRRGRGVVKPVLLSAIGAFLLVAGWLFAADPTAPKHEAIKTGGLAGGAIVALYALWLNDRRRRTDEDRQRIESERQALENARAEHDRSRVADERFARSVELLGHDAEQVRVGAMHGLAGLARSRAEYTQTVLDVLCAYLRRPFDETWTDDEVVARDERELEVRLTAQRLIADLLPHADTADAPRYDLDLTRAYLEYFDLSHRQVGNLTLRAAQLRESNAFHHTVVHGGAWFTDATSDGRLYAHHAVFHGKAWFSRFRCHDTADFTATRFLGPNKFAGVRFTAPVTFADCEFAEPIDFADANFRGGVRLELAKPQQARTHAMYVSLEHENALPDGWVVERRDDRGLGLVRS